MTNGQPNDDIESRLSRLENLMSSAGDFLVETNSLARSNAAELESTRAVLRAAGETLIRASAVTERNALDIEALTQDVRRNASDIRAISQGIQALTERVNSLAAASEQHGRILDYLLRRDAGDTDAEQP